VQEFQLESRFPTFGRTLASKITNSSARREKPVQVMGHGKTMVHYPIQMASETRLALYLFQFVDSSDASQFERKGIDSAKLDFSNQT